MVRQAHQPGKTGEQVWFDHAKSWQARLTNHVDQVKLVNG